MNRLLQALRVGNFKAFADTQRIPLKPITLIFGPNSAGKSSFIHSLALAHEAQFGREKRSLSRLDVHHTDVGGSAIDLGGFRQYVHRGQLNRRVEWGAELKVSALSQGKDQRLAQLLAPVSSVAVNMALGMELDDQDRPQPGVEPRVDAIEIIADGVELLRMSHRPATAQAQAHAGHLRLDRLASDHAVFRQVLKAIVEAQTTSEEMRPEDFEAANDAIAGLLPELVVRIGQFFPSGVELPKGDGADIAPVSRLFPVSKGNRSEDIAQALRFVLPRTLNDLIRGLADVLAGELKQLQYLSPLRSFPPRHLAFAEYEDANWYAGGGSAWDEVRRDDAVRDAVNVWLSSPKLKTPYKLVVRSLVALDQLQAPLEEGLERLQDNGLMMEHEEESRHTTGGAWPVIKDVEAAASDLLGAMQASDADRIRELVLVDQRTNTVVTHRDVGTGTRDQLVNQIKSQADQFFAAAHLYIPYLAYQKGDVQRNINDLTRSVEEAGQLVEGTKKDIEQRRREIGDIIIAAREAAASVGVAHFTVDFNAEADAQDLSAEKWLKTTAGLAAVTILAALLLAFIPVAPEATTPQVIQLFTSKVVILGLLFTATIWCGRLYKAARHQGAINKHRANALKTFQAFTKAASDDAARNAVLMETTKSIFAITPSGYLENESAPDGGLKIVEVVKHATQAISSVK